MAGEDWAKGFLSRHPNLTIRMPQNISMNRATAFNRINVAEFFDNLSKVISNYATANIWNMDECGFSTVPAKVGKVIARKGVRGVKQIAAQERGTLVTLALAVNGMGHSIPPFYIFPRKNMQKAFMIGASNESVGIANESGYMNQVDFLKFIHHFAHHSNTSQERPTLLILDNCTAHLSIDSIDFAREHGITMVSIPPHCSHKLQPLDVGVFGPVKIFYTSETKNWQMNNKGRALEIHDIPALVEKALDRGATPVNIKAGFKKTGG